jgi:hypothetical protein
MPDCEPLVPAAWLALEADLFEDDAWLALDSGLFVEAWLALLDEGWLLEAMEAWFDDEEPCACLSVEYPAANAALTDIARAVSASFWSFMYGFLSVEWRAAESVSAE